MGQAQHRHEPAGLPSGAIAAAEIKSTWEPLTGQNVNIESEGDAGRAQAYFDPKTNTVFLIADHIRAGTEMAVAAHELMHKHGQSVLGKDGWDKLHSVISTWANADPESDERLIYNYAASKVRAVGESLSSQELFPYAVEGALKAGYKPNAMARHCSVQKWLAGVIQSMKEVWGKITGKPDTFKVQDLVDLAFAIAQRENPANASISLDAGQNDAAKPDQTDTPAFRNWFGDSKVVDSDGKPLVVYHGTKNAPTEFAKKRTGYASTFLGDYEVERHGIFAAESHELAEEYANQGEKPTNQTVMPLYLRIEDPLDTVDGQYTDGLWNRIEKAAETLGAESPYRTARHIGDLWSRGELWKMFDADENQDPTWNIALLKEAGFDGMRIYERSEGDVGNTAAWVAFDPTQIKSATGNSGQFDGENPDIRFSRSLGDTLTSAANSVRDVSASTGIGRIANKAVDVLNDRLSYEGTVGIWHKTFGSMFQLAKSHPPFQKVFNAAQDFINDVAYYASEASDLAPKLLPKLEDWKDIGKQPISSADNQAIQAPIFEGTLSWARDESGKPVKMSDLEEAAAKLTTEQKAQRLLRGDHISENVLKMWQGLPIEQFEKNIESKYERDMLRPGVVWTPAELKSMFNLTGVKQANGAYDGQIGLYQEFRNAIDNSLDNTAKVDMLRYAGEPAADLREMILDAPDADTAAVLLRDHLLTVAEDDPGQSESLIEVANNIMEQADRVNKLKAEGYAPLSRFGQYSVDVVVDGKREYFDLFETKEAANQMAAKMRMEFGIGKVQTGTISAKEFQLFQGMTPESMELFGNMLGLDAGGENASDTVFQTYLRFTKNNRSAMKRLMHRKGIAGFSTDTGRVLASFIYSNARLTSSGLHMGTMDKAVQDIPKGQGQLKDAAIELREYIKNPREEAQAMRGLLFAQYLGGNVASMLMNFMQVPTVSLPYLSQFGGVK